MPNPFDELEAELSAVMGDEFGDTATLLPRLPSDYVATSADPARPQRVICGIFSSGPVLARLDGEGRGAGFNTRRATESPVFWLSAETVCRIGYDIRPGDELLIAQQSGTPFKIVAILPTDRRDFELHLTR